MPRFNQFDTKVSIVKSKAKYNQTPPISPQNDYFYVAFSDEELEPISRASPSSMFHSFSPASFNDSAFSRAQTPLPFLMPSPFLNNRETIVQPRTPKNYLASLLKNIRDLIGFDHVQMERILKTNNPDIENATIYFYQNAPLLKTSMDEVGFSPEDIAGIFKDAGVEIGASIQALARHIMNLKFIMCHLKLSPSQISRFFYSAGANIENRILILKQDLQKSFEQIHPYNFSKRI